MLTPVQLARLHERVYNKISHNPALHDITSGLVLNLNLRDLLDGIVTRDEFNNFIREMIGSQDRQSFVDTEFGKGIFQLALETELINPVVHVNLSALTKAAYPPPSNNPDTGPCLA